jgi:serine/threonine protein kinase
LAEYVEFKKQPKQDLSLLFAAASSEAIDLLRQLLTYDPRKRITAKAVRHLCALSFLLAKMLTSTPANYRPYPTLSSLAHLVPPIPPNYQNLTKNPFRTHYHQKNHEQERRRRGRARIMISTRRV